MHMPSAQPLARSHEVAGRAFSRIGPLCRHTALASLVLFSGSTPFNKTSLTGETEAIVEAATSGISTVQDKTRHTFFLTLDPDSGTEAVDLFFVNNHVECVIRGTRYRLTDMQSLLPLERNEDGSLGPLALESVSLREGEDSIHIGIALPDQELPFGVTIPLGTLSGSIGKAEVGQMCQHITQHCTESYTLTMKHVAYGRVTVGDSDCTFTFEKLPEAAE